LIAPKQWIEGVLVAKKDYNAPKHEELSVPNLEVIKAMQSLTSKGFVKTQFSWQWYYYVLTPEGVEYLREWCLPVFFAFMFGD
jgi:small subunit ribosomal protein S10e